MLLLCMYLVALDYLVLFLIMYAGGITLLSVPGPSVFRSRKTTRHAHYSIEPCRPSRLAAETGGILFHDDVAYFFVLQ